MTSQSRLYKEPMSEYFNSWLVETAKEKEVCNDQKTAYQYAEAFQMNGQSVEVWHDGKLHAKFAAKEQYRFVF